MTLRPRSRIARRLRRDATDVEKLVWRVLREQCKPWRFRRQHPIGNRIADFACPAAKTPSPPPGAERGFSPPALDALLSRFDPDKHRHDLMLDGPATGSETF